MACNAAVNSTDLLYKHVTKYVTQSDISVGVSVEVGHGLLVLDLVIFRPTFSPQRQSGVVLDRFAVGFLGNIRLPFLRHQIGETTKHKYLSKLLTIKIEMVIAFSILNNCTSCKKKLSKNIFTSK